ncbi:DUF3656 domain-containing U32 family peptidase [Acetonema longum]|uniref:Peptidase U32 n=1 Tax=Acetonema longum DSM 6540 TaxID=1009370 RepID=F7NNF0_9FIRM|nr:U32 family peptidase [Acetonema longum]EGO62391.1 peptidase U32 [Acetonema longum DSM 6540]
MTQDKPELLAPAGSREAFIAAVQAGADAVYLGGKAFGARHYAPNFQDEELAWAVRYAHLRDVKVYVTVNILVDDSEAISLVEYLRQLYMMGVDAIIVQDAGVIAIAQKAAPNFPLHASTQMTIYNLAGVEFLAKAGLERVVLAREVSLADIQYICRHSPVEIETFTHGALCICYSGQCLMSSMIGGRSGNRGRCAQPCRLPYQLVDRKGQPALDNDAAGEYLLSPKDLCTLELLPQFIQAGIASFKLEGRMKRAEYVSVVVDTYRQAIDRYFSGKEFVVSPHELKNLAQSFNRGFTTAYLLRKEGREMMSDRRPNNRGTYVGRISGYDATNRMATVKLEEPLGTGDIIECWVKVGGRVNITVSSMQLEGRPAAYAPAGSEVTIPVTGPVKISDRVFRTFDAKLTERARSFFSGDEIQPMGVTVTVQAEAGKPLEIIMEDEVGNQGRAATDFLAEPARKHPLTSEGIAKQVGRLGNTPFVLRELACHFQGELMVPVSEINEARRKAVEALEEARLTKFHRPALPPLPPSQFEPALKKTAAYQKKPLLIVNTDTPAKAKTAWENGADVVMFGGESFTHTDFRPEDYREAVCMARAFQRQIILSTPRITKEWQTHKVRQDISLFQELQPDAIAVSNLGTLELVRRLSTCPIHGDFPLNTYNSFAIDFYQSHGISSLTLSPELNFSQIEKIVGCGYPVELECLVHGYVPLMVSEHCVIGSHLGNLQGERCERPCCQKDFWLKDRMNELFPLATDQFCRMHVLNAKELSMLPHVGQFGRLGLGRIRIEAKKGSVAFVSKITSLYRQLLDQSNTVSQEEIQTAEHENITRGHYFRGVL